MRWVRDAFNKLAERKQTEAKGQQSQQQDIVEEEGPIRIILLQADPEFGGNGIGLDIKNYSIDNHSVKVTAISYEELGKKGAEPWFLKQYTDKADYVVMTENDLENKVPKILGIPGDKISFDTNPAELSKEGIEKLVSQVEAKAEMREGYGGVGGMGG